MVSRTESWFEATDQMSVIVNEGNDRKMHHLRELGIAAVVSATGASSTIPNVARITVDGSRGDVIIHGECQP